MAVIDGVDCEYLSRCKGKGDKCESCTNNQARDYYEAKTVPYTPSPFVYFEQQYPSTYRLPSSCFPYYGNTW